MYSLLNWILSRSIRQGAPVKESIFQNTNVELHRGSVVDETKLVLAPLCDLLTVFYCAIAESSINIVK